MRCGGSLRALRSHLKIQPAIPHFTMPAGGCVWRFCREFVLRAAVFAAVTGHRRRILAPVKACPVIGTCLDRRPACAAFPERFVSNVNWQFLCAESLPLHPYVRARSCRNGSHAPFCLLLSTHCWMKYMPSTPSSTFGYTVSVASNGLPSARKIMSSYALR